MVVGSSLRDVGPFQPDVAQMVYDFIAGGLAHRMWRIRRRMTRITCNPAGFHGHCNAHPHCCCTALVVLMPNLGACLLRGDILQEQQQTRC